MKIFWCYFLIVANLPIYIAPSVHAQDSVSNQTWIKLDQSEANIQYIDQLSDIVSSLYKDNPNLAVKDNREALELALKINYQKGIGTAYLYFGWIYSRLDQKDSAIIYFDLALEQFIKIGYKKEEAQSENNLGNIYYRNGEIKLASQHFNRAASIYTDIKDSAGLSVSLGNLGITASNKGDFYKSIKFYLKSLKISELINDSIGIVYTTGNLGMLFTKLEDFELALSYTKKAIDFFNILRDEKNAAVAMANLGDIYLKMKEYDKALNSFQIAENVHRELNNYSGLALCYNNIAIIHEVKNEGELSLKYAKEAYRIYLNIDEIKRKSFVFITLANAYNSIGNYDSALFMLKKGLEILNNSGKKTDLVRFYNSIHKVYEKKGNHLNSVVYLNKYLNLNDTIYLNESNRQILDLHESFLYERKENENHLLRKEKNLQEQLLGKIGNQRYLLYLSMIGLTFIMIILVILQYGNKVLGERIKTSNEKALITNKKLEEANELLFMSQADLSITNEELVNTNKYFSNQIADRSSTLNKSRYVMSNILEISSDFLYNSFQQISHVAERNESYKKKDGIKSLDEIFAILDKSDELFEELIELKELAKRSTLLIEKMNFQDLVKEVWLELSKIHDISRLVPDTRESDDYFDSDYAIARSLVYNTLEYILNQAYPKVPSIKVALIKNEMNNIITISIQGQSQIPVRLKKSLLYLYQQAKDGSKKQIILHMIKIALDKLNGRLDISNSSLEDSDILLVLPIND